MAPSCLSELLKCSAGAPTEAAPEIRSVSHSTLVILPLFKTHLLLIFFHLALFTLGSAGAVVQCFTATDRCIDTRYSLILTVYKTVKIKRFSKFIPKTGLCSSRILAGGAQMLLHRSFISVSLDWSCPATVTGQ